MRRTLAIAVLVLVAMCVSTVAFAGEGETLRPRRLGERPRLGQDREEPQGPGGGPMHRGPLAEFLELRMEMIQRLLNTEEGKALREEMKKSVEALQAGRKELHEKIRQEIQGGKNPREVLPQYRDQLKALLKKGLLLRIECHEKLLDLARKNIDKGVDIFHEELRERLRERLGQFRGGERPTPPRPREGGANPFEE